jgi:hypothetical protein
VDLYADPVELPLDRSTLEPGHRVGDGLGRRREHRHDRLEELESDAAQAGLAVAHRDRRSARQVPREHCGASRDLGRSTGCLGDRVEHQSRERSLP